MSRSMAFLGMPNESISLTMLITMHNFISYDRVLREYENLGQWNEKHIRKREGRMQETQKRRGKDGNGHGVIRISGVYW